MKSFEIPETIAHYKILSVLGRGGMGVVYLAEDDRLKRRVAIKCLYKQTQSQALVERLRREAKVLAKLNHPNVLHIYDVVDDEQGFALVMEYVEGRSLNRYLKENNLSQRQQLALLVQILDGLAAAHSEGIIHRDLKMDNILIDAQGRAKIGDFGIAKRQSGDTVELTKHNNISGSLTVMSPEQIRGEKLSAASDVFSFGLLAWQILRGQHAFAADSELLVVEKILNEQPPSLAGSDLPRGFTDCLDQTLHKEANQRPVDIVVMIKTLRSFSGQLSDDVEDPTLTVNRRFVDAGFSHEYWLKLAASLSFFVLFLYLLSSVYYWLKPEPETVYVAVLPPTLSAETSEVYDDIQKTVEYALQQGVISLDKSHLIPPDEVGDYLEEDDQLLMALGADVVLSSELQCADFNCTLRLFKKSASSEESRSIVLNSDELLETHRLAQLSLAEFFPGRDGLLSLSEVISEQNYKEYIRLRKLAKTTDNSNSNIVGRLQQLLEASPAFEPLYDLFVQISLDEYSETGNDDYAQLAFAVLEKAVDAGAEDKKIRMLTIEALAEVGRIDEAEQHILELEKAYGKNREVLVIKGIIAERAEQYQKAIGHFRQANELRPSVRTFRDIAINYWFLGQVNKAIDSLHEALKINPDDLKAGISLATFYMTKGDLDNAEKLYLRYEKRSKVPSTYANIGLIYMLKREYEKAEEYLKVSGELLGGNGLWRLNLADVYTLQGNHEQAKVEYSQFTESYKGKNETDRLMAIAQAYIHMGDVKQALLALKGAKEISPNNSDVMYAEAIIYTKLQDYPSALVAIERSIDLGLGTVWYSISWFDELCKSPVYGGKFTEFTSQSCI